MRNVSLSILFMVATGFAVARPASAQFTPPSNTPNTGHQQTTGLPPLSDTSDPTDPTAALRHAQQIRAAMNDRQKRIVADTERLLKLAQELKEEVGKTTKDEMSLDVIRKADEIERLAHDVKQRMKG